MCKEAFQSKRLGRCQLLANLIPELRKCGSQPIYKSNDFRLADGRCHHSIRRLGRSRTALLSRFFLHYKLYDSTSPLYTASTGSPTCEHMSGFATVSCSSAELGLAQPQQLSTCSFQLRSSPMVSSLDTAGAQIHVRACGRSQCAAQAVRARACSCRDLTFSDEDGDGNVH